MNQDHFIDTLMEQLYFVISYEELIASIDWDNNYKHALRTLIEKGWVNQLYYDEASFDYVKQDQFDKALHSFSYLATKKGLLAHNGF